MRKLSLFLHLCSPKETKKEVVVNHLTKQKAVTVPLKRGAWCSERHNPKREKDSGHLLPKV